MENKFSIQYSKLGLLSISHLVNDFYSNYLPQMLPFLVVLSPGFTATKAAILTSAFTITSSFVQPFFGYFLDRQGKRWFVYAGTIWMAVMLSLTGIVQHYEVQVLLAGLAGLGTAAFHPQASAMVNVLGGRQKAVSMSAFVACGNFGYALSPLLLIPLFQVYGLHASLVTIIPGIITCIVLFLFAPHNDVLSGSTASLPEVIVSLKSASRELFAIMGVIAVRSLAYSGMLTILPLYFKSENLSNIASSHLITILLLAGAVGGILGGFISDYIGRKRLIVCSFISCVPLYFLFLNTQGILSTIFLALAGAVMLSSFPVTVIAAQEAIPQNKALASGLTMGFAGGIGGLAVIIIGNIGDTFGLTTAVYTLFLLPIAAGLFGLLMKSRPSAQIRGMKAS